MSNRSSRLLAVLVIASLVASAAMVGGAAAADPTIDSGSGVSDGTTISHDANESETHTVRVTAANSTDVDDFAAEFSLNDSDHHADGTVFAENTSMVNVSTDSGGSHYEATFDEGELADVPMDHGENVTMDLKVYNTSNTSDAVTIQVYLNNTGDRAVVYVGDNAVENESDLVSQQDTTREFFGQSVPLYGEDSSEISADNVGINGSSTNVILVLGNDSVSDDFEDDEAGLLSLGAAGDVGTLESEEWSPDSAAYVDGDAVRLYNAEIPSDYDATAASYEEDVGGHPAVVMDLGDEAEDETSIDVQAKSDLDFFEQRSAFGLLGALGLPGVSIPLVGSVAILGAIKLQHRRNQIETEA